MLWAIWIVSGLVFLVGLPIVILIWLGKGIPEEHVASGAIDVSASAEEAFALIENVSEHPSWNKVVSKVEMLPEKHGLQTCRMHMGRNSFVLVRTKHQPPRVIEQTISDERGPFGGTWLYTITPKAGGCEIKLTENGRVKSPLPRAVMKYVMGYHMYLNMQLKALGARLGGGGKPRKV
jgi:ribosome-associated toxin RatA of RatAB toxin-antitoxin module